MNCDGDYTEHPTSRTDYEAALREMREKEKELTKRTEMLENMLRNLTTTIATSSPVDLNASPPSFNLSTQQSPPRNTDTGYSKFYLRDALEMVPKYDGHNIPVWQFARACKRARESVPLIDEAHFVRMLRNKLSNHAYLAVEDEIHPTVEKFLDFLKRTFGPGRNSNYYRGQLSMAYKKSGEHILDYIGRIKDLKTAIVEGDQTNLNRVLSEPELASIESFALEAFYEGLPREYRAELRAEGYNGLRDACSKAITISKRLEREDARAKNIRNPRDYNLPANQTQIPQQNPLTTPTFNVRNNVPDTTGQKMCSYCKNIGHLFNECRKRQYRERFNHNYSNQINHNPPSRNSGNSLEVSTNGANRDLSQNQPLHYAEAIPGPSTSSEETMDRCLP